MSDTVISNTNEVQTPILKLGQFLVKLSNNESFVIDRLTPQEMAEGWQQVLPHRKNYNEHSNKKRDHFSVFLSQLPDHLFSRLQLVRDDKTQETKYKDITDKIYQYSIKMTKHDDKIHRLQQLLHNIYPYRREVEQLVTELEKEHVKGWLILRARYLMKEIDA